MPIVSKKVVFHKMSWNARFKCVLIKNESIAKTHKLKPFCWEVCKKVHRKPDIEATQQLCGVNAFLEMSASHGHRAIVNDFQKSSMSWKHPYPNSLWNSVFCNVTINRIWTKVRRLFYSLRVDLSLWFSKKLFIINVIWIYHAQYSTIKNVIQ